MAQTPAPIISFNKTHHDFGKMPSGKSASFEFIITNIGDALLQIKEVRESCNCSKARVPKWRLAPNESTSIQVNFNPIGMLGNVHKSVTIISDDPANPKAELTFGASVVQEVMPDKSIVFFNEVSRYGTASSTIRLESGNEKPVEVTDVVIPVPYISCEAQREGNDIILNLAINGQSIPKHSNRGSDTLAVHTTSQEVPALQFHIEWDTLSEIIASPKRIVWNGDAGTELRATVTLSHSGGKAFKILGIQFTSPYLKTENVNKDSAAEHKLDVVMAPNAKAGMYHEKLIMKLDGSEQNELEIGVAAVLR
jgi:hypothetical protein